ncbi:MAG: YdjY domain-containing protein [Acidobacteriota bacterium]
MYPCSRSSIRILAGSAIVAMVFGSILLAGPWQQTPQNPPQKPPPTPPPLPGTKPPGQPSSPPEVKKISDTLLQLGSILVDTQKKEVTVSGQMLPDRTLEFLASQKAGYKLYESAMELDTDAVSFNLALILIGLQKSNAVVPKGHFDPAQAAGDPVEIWVEWGSGDSIRKVRGEELLYDLRTKQVPQTGGWVYTGSTVLPDGRYMAEMDGVLIGFVHDPASLIENSLGAGMGAYGSIHINPNLNIAGGTPLKLTIKAIQKKNQE